MSESVSESRPLSVVAHRDHAPLLLACTWIRTPRSAVGPAVALRANAAALCRGLHEEVAEQADDDVHLSQLDVCPVAGSLSADQTGDGAEGAEPPGQVVGIHGLGSGRWIIVGVVPEVHEAA